MVKDIDSGSCRLLWEQKSRSPIHSWDVVSAINDDDLVAYIVFSDTSDTIAFDLRPPWYSICNLKFYWHMLTLFAQATPRIPCCC